VASRPWLHASMVAEGDRTSVGTRARGREPPRARRLVFDVANQQPSRVSPVGGHVELRRAVTELDPRGPIPQALPRGPVRRNG
jgi:hypothetical protein